MDNKDWVIFLSEKWNVSHTVAKEMLHALHEIKKNDDFKKSLQTNKTNN